MIRRKWQTKYSENAFSYFILSSSDLKMYLVAVSWPGLYRCNERDGAATSTSRDEDCCCTCRNMGEMVIMYPRHVWSHYHGWARHGSSKSTRGTICTCHWVKCAVLNVMPHEVLVRFVSSSPFSHVPCHPSELSNGYNATNTTSIVDI